MYGSYIEQNQTHKLFELKKTRGKIFHIFLLRGREPFNGVAWLHNYYCLEFTDFYDFLIKI
jgi:hypothetical protein